MTENFAYSHINLPGQTRAGFVGNCLPGVECKLSEEGEVLVKSEATMPGYYKAPELTAACFTDDGFLKTGDRGEIDDQGRLKITGRVKELFKTSKGKYIAPVPIENLLNADRHIEQSCVSGVGSSPTVRDGSCCPRIQRAVTTDPASRERITTALEGLLLKINERVAGYERLQFHRRRQRSLAHRKRLSYPNDEDQAAGSRRDLLSTPRHLVFSTEVGRLGRSMRATHVPIEETAC